MKSPATDTKTPSEPADRAQEEAVKPNVASTTGLESLQKRVRQTKPWQHSTGPKTAAGKARSKMNALRHGLRSEKTRAEAREAWDLIRALKDVFADDAAMERMMPDDGQATAWLERIAGEM